MLLLFDTIQGGKSNEKLKHNQNKLNGQMMKNK